MSNRPSIPAEIAREILIECGHRCAVCGTGCPLERAHIIPWHESREHKIEDLICLCANCHERADREKWGEATLREYKRRPWVLRQYENERSIPEPKTKVELTIEMELDHFDEKNQRWLQHAIAGFLEISPNAVRITLIERSKSVKVTIELPKQSAEKLLSAYQKNDPELIKYLDPLVLTDLRLEADTGEQVPPKFTADMPKIYSPNNKVKEMIRQKIETQTARAGVIGLGYVGLPLMVTIAKAGFPVTGIDISRRKVECIQGGISDIPDIPSETLAPFVQRGQIQATTDYQVLSELDTVNICVPTPLRKSKDPDMSFIIAAVDAIAQYIHKGQLIILESTTYPGTTEELVLPTLQKSGLRVGKDFFLAFSPERIDPGNQTYSTANTPKIVGGITPACTEIAQLFYEQFINKV
ncbi:nucleotide sugar dehydrogenase, partial [Candidatus Poribacteria bacterium]|nr:nucleotide sugar dehydrogenase [Candidatus Poribacteria bacterium]